MAATSSCNDRLLNEARLNDFLSNCTITSSGATTTPGHTNIRQLDSCSPATGLAFSSPLQPPQPPPLVCTPGQSYPPHDCSNPTRYHQYPIPGTLQFTYPSPPLTGPAFSIVPLPAIENQCDLPSIIDVDSDLSCIGALGESDSAQIMSQDGSRGHEPLSPPPTRPLGTLNLPSMEVDSSVPLDRLPPVEDEDVSSHRQNENPLGISARVGSSSLLTPVSPPDRHSWDFPSSSSLPARSSSDPPFPPMHKDSGFAEFLPEEQRCGEDEFGETESWKSYGPEAEEPEPIVLWTTQSPPHKQANHLGGNGTHSDCYTAEHEHDEYENDTYLLESPRPKLLSLDLPDLDDFPPPGSTYGYEMQSDEHICRPPLHPLDIPTHGSSWQQRRTTFNDSQMDIDAPHPSPPPPHSPNTFSLHLPPLDPFPDTSYDGFYNDIDASASDTVMPHDEESSDGVPPPLPPPSPSRRAIYALPGELDDDSYQTPAMFGSSSYPPDHSPIMVPSSSHQGDTSTFGLGLFLPPSAIDPPIVRSPSPEDEENSPEALAPAFSFSGDPEVTAQLTAECEGLRALRRRALAAERAARVAEAELGERVTSAASALLPPLRSTPFSSSSSTSSSSSSSSSASSSSSSSSPSSSYSSSSVSESASEMAREAELTVQEKRMRKRELQAAMDARAEARRIRKREKQRARETGTLLELKMRDTGAYRDRERERERERERDIDVEGYSMDMDKESDHSNRDREGKGVRTVAQLVAGMMLRRRETSRPLAGRAPTSRAKPYVPSALYSFVSLDDIMRPREEHGEMVLLAETELDILMAC